VAAGFEFAGGGPTLSGTGLKTVPILGSGGACRLGGVVASWHLSNVKALCHNKIGHFDSRWDLNALQRRHPRTQSMSTPPPRVGPRENGGRRPSRSDRSTLKQARGAGWLDGRTSTRAIDQQLNRAWLAQYNSARSEDQQTKSLR